MNKKYYIQTPLSLIFNGTIISKEHVLTLEMEVGNSSPMTIEYASHKIASRFKDEIEIWCLKELPKLYGTPSEVL